MAKKDEATVSDDRVELDVSVSALREALAHLRARLRRTVLEMRSTPFSPGSLAGIVADIKALEGIKPLASEAPAPPAPPTIEDARAEQAKAHGRHKADEQERMRGG